MKKFAMLLGLVPFTMAGQSLVYPYAQNRTALLEDFTGIHCGYCPEGHAIAASLEAADPERVVVVGVHAGIYAVPNTGEPDFRTTEGTTLDDHFAISGYPAGVINRRQYGGSYEQGRGAWETDVHQALDLTSPVNLGLSSSFNAGTRDLTVNVELLYTANSPGGNDYISVLLKEDHIIGWQTDYANGNHPNYDHTNVLRAYMTDVWGDEVTTTTAGTSVTRTYTYTVPLDFDVSNCKVVAFVSEYQNEVYQAREVPADGGTTLVVGDLVSNGPVYAAGGAGTNTDLNGSLQNLLGSNADYLVDLSSTNAPGDWSGSFTILGSTYSSATTVTLNNGSTEPITVTITPGGTPAIADYTLSVSSVNDPNAPILTKGYHIISGITDLVVSNPQAEPYEPLYNDALATVNENGRGSSSRATFIGFGENNALTDVINVYMNVGWTFPSLTDDMVAVLADHLDHGGNMMIAGQDIGWDQSGDPNAYGTPNTQAFYQNYMHAQFVADGSTANSSVDFVDADAVFGGLTTSSINTVYGATAVYPEEITPISPATAIFNYNGNANKIGGLRALTGNKVVYFGVAPEQMTNAQVGAQMVSLSHDWFYNGLSVEEFDAAFQGTPYPVPASTDLYLPLTREARGAVIEVLDALGRVVMVQRAGEGLVHLDVRGLTPGTYAMRIVAVDGRATARTFNVAR
ncbi:MAG: Omp28-related outer membrane protein [Flavobacteriales bacterium]|nr:Omp28-related outer membrane protein [Flavobacteriales bacterium]MCB9167298.1 Omp28-related outer membrane protein [Flavobacteriales bacterium]